MLILCRSYYPEALQATTSEGLEEGPGPYEAARMGFELRPSGRNVPNLPLSYHAPYMYVCICVCVYSSMIDSLHIILPPAFSVSVFPVLLWVINSEEFQKVLELSFVSSRHKEPEQGNRNRTAALSLLLQPISRTHSASIESTSYM